MRDFRVNWALLSYSYMLACRHIINGAVKHSREKIAAVVRSIWRSATSGMHEDSMRLA